jgi:phosphohistidine swiveling domain-containing protein
MTIDERQWVVAARGIATSFTQHAEGPLYEINGAREALDLMDRISDGEVTGPIVLVHEAGGTTVGPLLEEISGVVSTTGTLGAHVALLAKEYGCPCVVGAQWHVPAMEIERVRLDADGTVWAMRRED